jgi:hypothetical protein
MRCADERMAMPRRRRATRALTARCAEASGARAIRSRFVDTP